MYADTPTLPFRLLVVDDRPTFADTFADLLRALGADARAVYTGGDAVGEAAAWRPDAVFLNIRMHPMSGFEACRLIRAEPWGRDVLVVAVNGYYSSSYYDAFAKAGFDGVLTKPVTVEDVCGSLAPLMAAEMAK